MTTTHEIFEAASPATQAMTDPVTEWEKHSSGIDAHLLQLGDALVCEVKRLRLKLSDVAGAVEAVQRAHNETWAQLAKTTADLEQLKGRKGNVHPNRRKKTDDGYST